MINVFFERYIDSYNNWIKDKKMCNYLIEYDSLNDIIFWIVFIKYLY